MPSTAERDSAEARASEQRLVDEPKRRWIDRLSGLLLGIFALAFANLLSFFNEGSGQLRLANGLVGSLFTLLIFGLPAVVVVIRLGAPYTRAKWWIVAGLAPIAVLSGFFGLLYVGINGPSTLVKEITLRTQTIRCFRNSEFLSFSIDIQEERQILPGIVWSVPLHHEDRAVDVTIKIIDKNHLQCMFSIDNDIDGAYAQKSVKVLIR